MKVRTILLLNMALLLLLVLGSSYLLLSRRITREIDSISREQFVLLVDTLRLYIMDLKRAGTTMAELHSRFTTLRRQHPELLELRFVPGPPVLRQFGRRITRQPGDQALLKRLKDDKPLIDYKTRGDRAVIRFLYPMKAGRECLSCHEATFGQRLGALSMVLDVQRVAERIRISKQELLILHLAEIVLIFLILAYLLHLTVFRRLHDIRQGTARLAQGDLSRDVPGESASEIGALVSDFNHMAHRIRELLAERDETIREQAGDLAFMVQLGDRLDESSDLMDTLQQFCKVLTETAKVTGCRIALRDEDGRSLVFQAAYPASILPPLVTGIYTCNEEQCPGIWRVMTNRSELLLHREDECSARERELLLLDTAHSALCLPICNKEVLGLVTLIEFRAESRDPITAEKSRLCRSLTRQLAAVIENARLRERLDEHAREAILAMAEAVDKKSPWTAGHSQRVTDLAVTIARGMNISGGALQDLHTAGLLHDIGKIGTPGRILNKHGKLSPRERTTINRHPEDGAEILSKMKQFASILPAVRHHHEHYDGTGYPDGLKGEQIPLAARILAVADAYDAMTSDRPYRNGLARDVALSILREGKGTQFDPQVVDTFINCMPATVSSEVTPP